MKKILIISIALFITQTSFAQQAHKVNTRQGFFVGLGLGYGGIDFDTNGPGDFHRGAFLGNFRIGGGLSEQFLMMAESFAGISEVNDVTTSVSSLNFATQLFLTNNFYFRPGVGLSMVRTEIKAGSTTITTDSDAGFSMVGSLGYEFRIRSGFTLAPEANYNFNRVDGNSVTNYGGVLGLLWYF